MIRAMSDPTRSETHAGRHLDIVWEAMGDRSGWVVDFGCGEGLFAGVSTRYVGLDRRLEWVRPVLASGRPAVVGDVQRAPLRDGSCGGVLCMNILHALPDPARAIAEIDRVLAPGGRAYIKNRWHKGGGKAPGFWAAVSRALHLHHFRFWAHFRHPGGAIHCARNADGRWGICPRCVRRFFARRGYSLTRRLSGQVFILRKPSQSSQAVL